MRTPRVYNTEGIVLRQTRLGEADKLVCLYTPGMGKLRAVARGAYRLRSKLAGHVEPLTHSAFLIAQGQSLDVISQAQTLQSFLPLRQDLWRTACALYVAELVYQFTPEGAENYPLYRLLQNTLGWLGEAPTLEPTLRYFEMQLLEALGYRPQLYSCVSCHNPLEPQAHLFSPSGGGVLCPGCRSAEPLSSPISLNALKVMRLLQKGEYAPAARLRLEPGLARELERLMRGYLRYLLEKEIKSTGFLDRLRET
ncbi:MAG: DNA repair protein RecO [Chloroflexota bacterium]|nr:DNA repair protein RecO [Chloroflexota bacterium]